MKNKYILLFVATIILLLGSCKEIDKLTQFKVNYSAQFTIPSTIGINLPFHIPTPNIPTDISNKLENNQTNKELIEKLLLQKLTLVILNPSSEDFSFLKEVDLYIKTDNLPQIKVAYKHNISNTIGGQLDLDIVPDLDLQAYIKEPSFTLDSKIVTDELILQAIDVKADMTFWVDAKILGV